MPYRRRTYNRRAPRYRKRVPRYSRMVTGKPPMTRGERLLAAGAPYAKAVPALARTVGMFASMINSEPHFVDQSASNASVNTTGVLYNLCNVAVGDTDQTRTGNKTLGKDVLIRGTFATNSANTNTSQVIRMILFCDKEFDGVPMTPAQVLDTSSPLSALNQDYSKRFVVMKDYLVTLNPQRPSSIFKLYKKVPFHLFYDGTGATDSDCKENMICLLFISDQATNVPTVTFTSRFKWYDN